MQLPPIPFTVLDTETTGFVPRVHHVIEFASMRAEEGMVSDTYEQLFKVETEIPAHIQVLTRIKQDAIAKQPTMEEKREEVRAHIGDDTLLVGQNLSFDIGMLRGEGIDLTDRPWVDTSLLASLVFPEFRSYSLQYMSETLKLRHEPAHRALGDVRATLELFSRIWQRLLELSPKEMAFAKDVMGRASPGYRLLFAALPAGSGEGAPWIRAKTRAQIAPSKSALKIPAPVVGTVQLLEEGLHPETLQAVINGSSVDSTCVQWIAVKNLENALKRLHIPAGVSVIHPPQLLLDPAAAQVLLTQETFTVEEALLALKLTWFAPRTRNDVAIHGNEKELWNGRLACTDASPSYTQQFSAQASALLLDHRQLMTFLQDPDHAAHGTLTAQSHIIIDDASMLEDTATKAYGHECNLDELRAAAGSDALLTHLVDGLSIWLEKIRGAEDTFFLGQSDYDRSETKGLQLQVSDLLARTDLLPKTREQLSHTQALLHREILQDNLVWVEARINGSLVLRSAPENVSRLLQESLYDRFATTLIVPLGSDDGLTETIPPKTKTVAVTLTMKEPCPITVSFPADQNLLSFLQSPPPGKTILLAGSKRTIEQLFIAHTERLEDRGIVLICQGLSGGQGRMESEFIAAAGPAILIMTPWMYEGTQLPQGTADLLVLETLPFDHPNQPVYSKRLKHAGNGFEGYALPRVKARLFRLMRTFCRQRRADAQMVVLDKRVQERDYGRTLQAYLGQFAEKIEGAQPQEAPAKKQRAKKDDDQLKMF
jgi:DNA polymerase III epsilon subunit-like protein